jgi:hypothetical protein
MKEEETSKLQATAEESIESGAKEEKSELQPTSEESIESETMNAGKSKIEAPIGPDKEKKKEGSLPGSTVSESLSSAISGVSEPLGDNAGEVTLIDLAHEKAKEVFDIGFHLAIALALLFFQHRNCEIDENAFASNFIPDLTGNKTDIDSFWDFYDCNVPFELKKLSKEMQISLGIAAYGVIAGTAVILHAVFMNNQDKPPIQGIFDWTDRIPVIDSLLEIPFCLWIAPLYTLLLWAAYLLCCAGLVVLVISYEKESYENGNLSAFLLTACLVGFDLYRLTGDISQYIVINMSADIRNRKRDKEIIKRLTSMKQ